VGRASKQDRTKEGKNMGGFGKAFEGGIVALSGGAATVVLPLDGEGRHWFAGVSYYSDADGTPATPGAGTETYTVRTHVKPNVDQAFENNVINSADIEQANWLSPTKSVQVILAGVTTATHVQLRAFSNRP